MLSAKVKPKGGFCCEIDREGSEVDWCCSSEGGGGSDGVAGDAEG